MFLNRDGVFLIVRFGHRYRSAAPSWTAPLWFPDSTVTIARILTRIRSLSPASRHSLVFGRLERQLDQGPLMTEDPFQNSLKPSQHLFACPSAPDVVPSVLAAVGVVAKDVPTSGYECAKSRLARRGIGVCSARYRASMNRAAGGAERAVPPGCRRATCAPPAHHTKRPRRATTTGSHVHARSRLESNPPRVHRSFTAGGFRLVRDPPQNRTIIPSRGRCPPACAPIWPARRP